MREWLKTLPEWQTAFFAILIGVAGLAIIQISFEVARVHDDDVSAEAPALHIVEPPEGEPEPEPEGDEEQEQEPAP